MRNVQPKIQQTGAMPKNTVKTGSKEYWEILNNIASGKERVYSHEYVMNEVRNIFKR
ncbi:TPA: hypothetical protein RNY11_002075 [Pasteurella multocida]|nr:hypothetical protein [Pasteurella multocida]HDX1177492.1 hypothetical protein [Pasteurella multocida]